MTISIRKSDIASPAARALIAEAVTLNITELPEPIYTLRQSADGTPFVSYFEDNTSFCWSGEPTEPIEVSYGGAGEPVVAFIEWPAEQGRTTLAGHLDMFRAVCDLALVQVSQ